MQPLYFGIDPTHEENYKIKKDPVNFLTRVLDSVLDSVHTVIDPKNYLAVKTKRKKNARAKINGSTVLQDFFGALNY